MERRLGFAPQTRITAESEAVSAAIWQFEPDVTYELTGPATASNVIAMPIRGRFHHTYFADGRLKWSRMHEAFHMNLVVAGERPRGIFTSSQRYTVLHVYLPHRIVEEVARESYAAAANQSIWLIDPMCAPDPDIEAICRALVREMEHPDRCVGLMFDVLMQALVIRLLRRHSNISNSLTLTTKSIISPRDWRLRRAIDYLEAHLGDDVSLGELAGVAGLSTTRLTSLFRDGTGESPHRYLMRRRFERACEMLGNPAISISDVAHHCGFANSGHLTTVVRRRLAMTPTALRNQLLCGSQ